MRRFFIRSNLQHTSRQESRGFIRPTMKLYESNSNSHRANFHARDYKRELLDLLKTYKIEPSVFECRKNIGDTYQCSFVIDNRMFFSNYFLDKDSTHAHVSQLVLEAFQNNEILISDISDQHAQSTYINQQSIDTHSTHAQPTHAQHVSTPTLSTDTTDINYNDKYERYLKKHENIYNEISPTLNPSINNFTPYSIRELIKQSKVYNDQLSYTDEAEARVRKATIKLIQHMYSKRCQNQPTTHTNTLAYYDLHVKAGDAYLTLFTTELLLLLPVSMATTITSTVYSYHVLNETQSPTHLPTQPPVTTTTTTGTGNGTGVEPPHQKEPSPLPVGGLINSYRLKTKLASILDDIISIDPSLTSQLARDNMFSLRCRSDLLKATFYSSLLLLDTSADITSGSTSSTASGKVEVGGEGVDREVALYLIYKIFSGK